MASDVQDLIKLIESTAQSASDDTYASAMARIFAPRIAARVAVSTVGEAALEAGTAGAELGVGVAAFTGGLVAIALLGSVIGGFWLISKLDNDIPRRGPLFNALGAYIHKEKELHQRAATNTVIETLPIIDNIGKSVIKIVQNSLVLNGVSSLVHSAANAVGQHAPLSRLPYDVNSLTNRLSASLHRLANQVTTELQIVHRTIAQVWVWVHHILTRLDYLDHVTKVQAQHIQRLNNVVNHHTKIITQLENQIHHLQKQVSVDTTLIKHNTTTIGQHTSRLNTLEDTVTAIAMSATVLTLLAPLVQTGTNGIDNLTKLAEDPCRCFSIPNSPGWLLTQAVLWLYAENE